eukprot:PhM_4_TR16609/c0_g1_i1/m.5445
MRLPSVLVVLVLFSLLAVGLVSANGGPTLIDAVVGLWELNLSEIKPPSSGPATSTLHSTTNTTLNITRYNDGMLAEGTFVVGEDTYQLTIQRVEGDIDKFSLGVALMMVADEDDENSSEMKPSTETGAFSVPTSSGHVVIADVGGLVAHLGHGAAVLHSSSPNLWALSVRRPNGAHLVLSAHRLDKPAFSMFGRSGMLMGLMGVMVVVRGFSSYRTEKQRMERRHRMQATRMPVTTESKKKK